MTVKLLAIDMDETLLRSDKTYDAEAFLDMVKDLRKRGVVTCIASGNSLSKLEYYLSGPLQDLVYLAGENGNVIEKEGERIEEKVIALDDLLALDQEVHANPNYSSLVSAGDGFYSTRLIAENEANIRIYCPDITLLDSYAELEDLGHHPVKLAVNSFEGLAANKDFVTQMNATFPRITGVTSATMWMDFINAEGGKGSAVRYLQDKYQIRPEETMAFGDSLNDASMMGEVGYSVAMANADPDLKSLCRYEIGSNNEGAVLQVIDRYLQAGNLDFMADFVRSGD
ncbi:HAD family hydrolase [Aerococcus sp. UMB7834]|uniref:HAD family hydrolase n=1 Tax=Aerococcus sp. UMB7834 TaxID=3046342 RepID=UPI0025510B88|nr:HAD family hydrolase [Aerococcus sp. UMB7834]MDK6805640.1 HAD family hydrolase [Aerococcus sp. UMB7834]